jgi:hypothetical protein
MTYRHCTNLRTPVDPVDQSFLDALSDFKLGDPIPVKPNELSSGTPLTLEELREKGIVGLYTTDAALEKPEVRRKIGWGLIELAGPEWK